jgi:hypothetical protein
MTAFRSSRGIVAAALLVAVTLTIGFAAPAVGVPSISKVYRVAKKALKTGQSAKKGPKVIERQRVDIPAAPGDFAEFDIRCPRGYTAVGIGLGLGALEPVFFASYGNGALGSMYNPSDTTVFNGDVFVECVKSSGHSTRSASVPQMSRGEAIRRLHEAEADAVAAR